MNRKSWSFILALASVPTLTGCAATSGESLWARSTSVFRKPASESSTASVPKTEGDLSPEFKAAQKTFKNTEQTMLAWARYQEDVGEFADARKKYRELLIVYPECTEASIGLARIELLTGRTTQAEEILTELERNRPQEVSVKLALGRMYGRLERWQESIATFERAVELDAANQESRYELGLALARTHQFDPALAHLSFAVGESAAHYNIGYILHETGQDADAVEWFRNALAAHPDVTTADKSRTMLAQLTPRESGAPLGATLASAQGTRQHQQYAAATDPSGRTTTVLHDQSAVAQSDLDGSVSNRSPYDSAQGQESVRSGVVGGEVLLPPVSSLPAAGSDTGRAGSAAVRNVSWPGAPGPASSSTAPQQWNGPVSSPSSNASTTAGAVDPPQWRRGR